MRNIKAPGSAPEASANEPKKLHCNKAHFGCGLDVPEADYHKSAMVCRDCANRIGQYFGFTYESASEAIIQINLPWYEGNESIPGKCPWLKPLPYRTKARVLAFAAGSQGVKGLTAEERDWALRVREAVPDVYRVSERQEDPVRRVYGDVDRKMAAAGGW